LPSSCGRARKAQQWVRSVARRGSARPRTTIGERLRQLEEENGKLKKIVADLSLDKEMLQDVIRRKL
jgi:hypothetical protein